MIRDVGDGYPIEYQARDPDGTLVNATVALAVTDPAGNTSSGSPTNPSTGIYRDTISLSSAGVWRWKWTISGTVADVAYGEVTAADPAPPTYETLTNLKAALGISSDDTIRDVLLASNLAAASRGVDNKCGFPARRFWLDSTASARTYTPRGRVIPTADGDLFMVDDIGSLTGLVVEVGSGSTWTAVTGYETQPDNAIALGLPVEALLRPVGAWTGLVGTTRVRVTARWGWPDVPAEVVEATRIQASRLYKRKDSPEGVLGNAEWGTVRVARLDNDVVDLLKDVMRRARGFA